MKTIFLPAAGLLFVACLAGTGCGNGNNTAANKTTGKAADTGITDEYGKAELPQPYATKSVVNFSNVTGWPEGTTPKATAGFKVSRFAGGLNNPRWVYVAPNGDIFVAESNKDDGAFSHAKNVVTGKSKSENENKSANRIRLYRDADDDGVPELNVVFSTGIDRPFGMLVHKGYFYIAATGGVWRFPYNEGDTMLTVKGQKIVTLPVGGYNNHWTRNIIAAPGGDKLFISVGSGSNVAEHGMENEVRRANILEVNPDGSGETIYASGLRNPVGMAIVPGTSTLCTVVNERDELGDELVPDYLTTVQRGGFYGWPYSYYGQHKDPRLQKDPHPEMVSKAIVPDFPLGSHTASLGLCFYTGNSFPASYSNGAFIGQRGSWNRAVLAGYKVVFVPFKNGKPGGEAQDFLTGFIESPDKKDVHGRPVGVAVSKGGSLLVADDAGNTVWHVKAVK